MSHAYGEEAVDPRQVTRDPEGQRGEAGMHQAGRQCISALGAAWRARGLLILSRAYGD
jgi:hypothetical protein